MPASDREIWPRMLDRVSHRRIIISGTGRSGTTFLVQLFSALGFDTGYSFKQALDDVDGISNAGLERRTLTPDAPYVVKSPWFVDALAPALASGAINVAFAIVPMRDLFSAAESRRRVHAASAATGLDAKNHPGSLWRTTDPAQQEERLAEAFFRLMHTLAEYRIPTLLPVFPSLVVDPAYCFDCLEPLLARHGVDRAEFEAAHRAVARPELIHDFGQPELR